MMHEWKSQEKLIDEFDRGAPTLDPLRFKIFLYDKAEWDNVPQVIPRFHFHLQRYLRGLSAFCLEKSLEETTSHLREDVFAHFPTINGRIDAEISDRKEADRLV